MTTANTMITPNPVSGIADRAHQAVDKAAERAAPAIERASSVAHRTIDKVADAAAPAAQWAAESGRQIAAKSSELTEASSSLVRAQPLASIACALAIGYLIGRLTR
jgi:ElaB/YqjD/DUF883 family membrane-anchored ribosome-binding protein